MLRVSEAGLFVNSSARRSDTVPWEDSSMTAALTVIGIVVAVPFLFGLLVAIGLGLKAVQQGHRTLLTSVLSCSATLTTAHADHCVEDRLKLYAVPTLLMIAELGDIPIDRHGAHVFFPLISRRDERGAIILTANPSFGQWAAVFGEPSGASAILDRLLHHSYVINIQGDSYRLREKQQAGLLKKAPMPENL